MNTSNSAWLVVNSVLFFQFLTVFFNAVANTLVSILHTTAVSVDLIKMSVCSILFVFECCFPNSGAQQGPLFESSRKQGYGV